MQVNATTLAAIRKNYTALFNQGRAAYTPVWPQLAMRHDGAGFEQIIHKWIGGFPTMQAFKGDLKISNLVATDWTVTNEPWAAAIGLKEEEIERDQIGLYSNNIREMGRRGNQHPDYKLAELLNGAFATYKDYTGTYFFDTDKKHFPTKTSNKFTNKATAALAEASLIAGITALRALKDEEGMPFGSGGKLTLVVPPALEFTARKLVQLSTVATGGANVLTGTCDVLVLPMLTSTTAWFLMDLGGFMKPFINQIEKDIEFSALDDMNSDHWFKHHEALYQIYYRGKVAFGLPQLAYGSTGAS